MSEDPGTGQSSARTTAIVAGLFIVSSAAAAYEIVPASVAPIIRDSLAIGPTTAGFLVSVMYATAVVTSIPVGVVVDRTGVRPVVVTAGLALLFAGAWSWLAARAGAYWWLIASRVLGGLCYVVVWNAGANIISQVVRPERRATAIGVFTASAPVGFALGQFGGPLVTEALGWPAIFPVFAALAAAGVALFSLATAGGTLSVESAVPTRSELRGLAANRGAWTLYCLGFLAFGLYLFLNSWLPSYLTDEIGVGVAVGGALTALLPIVGIVARSGSGAVSDRVFGGGRRPVVVLSFVVATPAVAGFVLTSWVPAIVGLVVVAGLAIQLAMGLLFTYVSEVVAPEVRTTAIATMTSVGLLGAFLAPIGAGSIIGAAGYRPTFLVAGVLGAVGIVLAVRAPQPG